MLAWLLDWVLLVVQLQGRLVRIVLHIVLVFPVLQGFLQVALAVCVLERLLLAQLQRNQ